MQQNAFEKLTASCFSRTSRNL